MKRYAVLLSGLALALAASDAPTQPAVLPLVEPRTVPLWPDGSPHNPPNGPGPTLEIYRPFTDDRTASATVVILPGGGYAMLRAC